jgi:TonB family protein
VSVRFLIGLVSVLGLMAQTVPVQPIPTQVPPANPQPIPRTFTPPTFGTNAPHAPLIPRYPPLRKVEAKYTAEARAAALQGTVSLYVEVGSDGTAKEVQVMQGLGLGLDESAVEAVKQLDWGPRPGPDPIQQILEVDVPFHLDSPQPWTVDGEWYRITIPDRERHGEIARPVPIKYVAPEADACREAGTTEIRLTVGPDGSPLDVHPAVAGGNALSDAAIQAVEGWRFRPAEWNGKKLEAQGTVVFSCRPLAAAEKPAEPTPEYRVGGGVSAPALLSKTEPEYAERARLAKAQGTTLLYVQISPEGKATQLRVIRSLGMGLDEKAMEAVKQWRFRPGMKDGTPVTVEATIEVNFRLQ